MLKTLQSSMNGGAGRIWTDDLYPETALKRRSYGFLYDRSRTSSSHHGPQTRMLTSGARRHTCL